MITDVDVSWLRRVLDVIDFYETKMSQLLDEVR